MRKPENVLIAGASGLVGTALRKGLTERGCNVIVLERSKTFGSSAVASWWPPSGEIRIDSGLAGKLDAVINLAGAGIADKRWSDTRKKEIMSSRLDSTRLLARFFAEQGRQPGVFINASAVGYYGDRGDEVLRESSDPGDDFLADVCQQWESETNLLRDASVRVVLARLGVVLSTSGGALARMMPPFSLGLGGTVGSGRQFMSWIALEDVVGAFIHAIENDSLRGPVNLVAPHAVRNSEFTALLGRHLGRPAVIPLPAAMLRIALGEMGPALLCSSARVEPRRLEQSGYPFLFKDLNAYLHAVLRKK